MSSRRTRDARRPLLRFPALLPLCLLVALGCSKEITRDITKPLPASSADVAVRVVSWPAGREIERAACRLIEPARQETTDARGLVLFRGLPRGRYVTQISAAGHAGVLYTFPVTRPDSSLGAELDTSAWQGEISLAVHLLEAQAALDLQVLEVNPLRGDSAFAAVGRRVRLNWKGFDPSRPVGLFSGHELVTDGLPGTAWTDSAGRVELRHLPPALVELTVAPRDAEQDGPRGPVSFPSWTGALVVGATTRVTLTGALADEPGLVETNIPEGAFHDIPKVTSCSLRFLFSSPMDTSAANGSSMSLTDGGAYDTPLAARWSSTSALELLPIRPLPEPGTAMKLELQLVGGGGRRWRLWRDLTWSVPGACASGSQPGPCTESVQDLRLTGPARADFDTREFALEWSSVTGAGGYEIYVCDDDRHPDWIWLHREPSDPALGRLNASVVLPLSFDRFVDDTLATPLAGIEIRFCVVPHQAATPWPGGIHPILRVRDEIPPTVLRMEQTDFSENPAPDPRPMRIRVLFSEYIRADEPGPEVRILDQPSGVDPLYPAQATWEWGARRGSGTLRWDLQANQKVGGTRIALRWRTLADRSDNFDPAGYDSPPFVIPRGGLTDDFEQADLWTSRGNGWELGIPSIGPGGAHSGLRCWGTDMNTIYPGNWDGSLTSPSFRVPGTNPRLEFWSWFSLEQCPHERCDDVSISILDEDGKETTLQSYTGDSRAWHLASIPLGTLSGHRVQVRFRFHSDPMVAGIGYFLDDVAVVGD